MVPPYDKGRTSDEPEDEPELLGGRAPDLSDAQPPDDAERGAGVFEERIEGDDEPVGGYDVGEGLLRCDA